MSSVNRGGFPKIRYVTATRRELSRGRSETARCSVRFLRREGTRAQSSAHAVLMHG